MTFKEWLNRQAGVTSHRTNAHGEYTTAETRLLHKCWKDALTEAAEIARTYASGDPIAREIERARDGQE